MKFNAEEVESCEKIAVLSYEKKDVVTKVLKSFYLYSAMEIFSGKEEIILPSIGKIIVSFEDTIKDGKLVKVPVGQIVFSSQFGENLSNAKIGDIEDIADEARENITKALSDVIEKQ